MRIVLYDWVEGDAVCLVLPTTDSPTDLTTEESLRNSPYVAAFWMTNFTLS